ncbi:hypothetical protein tinsulaeT_25360 [Thalassotalea insulae]|uniref:Nitroreductase domain-containing protein n=1 Tax=Thalassotalea insulae TaxID=2056778 RepID=A0ABQ6GTC3_9GAMM|nr:SagB/ThcOx family dehydrogenase [Thalassotalea insulae]GLX79196.1 hypothetical protein tinsulaeT_25360 [Thalassotalea insulae]
MDLYEDYTPILACGYWFENGVWTFNTPHGIVELNCSKATRALKQILPKCNGQNTLNNVLNVEVQSELKVLEFLQKYKVIVDKTDLGSIFSEWSRNPQKLFRPRSYQDIDSHVANIEVLDYQLEEAINIDSLDSPSYLESLFLSRTSRREQSLWPKVDTHILKMLVSCYGVLTKDNKVNLLTSGVPSPGGLYPLKIFIYIPSDLSVLKTGFYEWRRVTQQLIKIKCNDKLCQSKMFNDESINDDSISVFVFGDYERVRYKYGNKAFEMLFLEAGHLMQSFYLYCEDVNLKFCEYCGFNPDYFLSSVINHKNLIPLISARVGS